MIGNGCAVLEQRNPEERKSERRVDADCDVDDVTLRLLLNDAKEKDLETQGQNVTLYQKHADSIWLWVYLQLGTF